MKRLFARHRKLVAIAATLVLAYSALGFLVFPVLIKKAAVQFLTNFLVRPVAVRSVGFNPFSMSANFRGVRIDEAGGGYFLAGARVYANFEPIASLLARAWMFKELLLVEPSVIIERKANGTLNFADLLLLDWPKNPNFRFGLLRVVGGKIVFRDAALPGGFSTTISPFAADIKDLSLRAGKESSFSIHAVSEAGEKLSWKGSLGLGPMNSRGEIAVDKIVINKYYPYFKDRLKVAIADGTLAARLSYDLELDGERIRASVQGGELDIRSLKVNEAGGSAPLFGLANLAIAGGSFDLQSRTIEAASLLVDGGRIVARRLPDGSLNFQHIARPARLPSAKKAGSPAEWRLAVGEIRVADFRAEMDNARSRVKAGWGELLLSKPAFQTKPMGGSIASIALREGILEFADSSVAPPARLAVTGLEIEIGGFSSADPRKASVAARAAIDATARLQIYGDANPIHGGGDTKIRALLQNVELTALSPYAAKYLGYELAAGDVSIDSALSIQGRRLGARNKIEIDRLKLGGKSAGKDATKLPIRVAIALIADSNGRITLEVPIEGTLDDPKLDLAKTFLEALFSPLMKTAADPFAAMGARLGKASEGLGFQEFLPGSAELLPREAWKLDTILEGLKRWPELMLDIEGSIDAKKDSGDLRLLAAGRAKAVADYLLRRGTVEPGRIFLVDAADGDVPSEGSRALLYLKDQYRGPGKQLSALP
jgi:hypothetical protein